MAFSLLLAASSDICFGCDSEASSSVARSAGSRRDVSIAPSRLLSGLSRASDAFFSGALEGRPSTCFFSTCLVGPCTSCSMAPANDLSSCGLDGIEVPCGGG